MSIESALTILVVACAVLVGVSGMRLGRDDTVFFVFVMLVLFVPAVWIPRFWRDVVVSGGIALVLWASGDSFWDKLGWSAAVTAPFYALSWFVPGGASVIVCGLTLIGLGVSGRKTWLRFERLRRLARLEPGVRSEGEVEVGGSVLPAREQATLPDLDLSRAGGWRLAGAPEKLHRPEHLELTTPAGLVLVDLGAVSLEDVRREAPKPESVGAWREALGLDEASHPTLEVIEADREAYVIGTPSWARASEGGGYRNTGLVPVFGAGSVLYQRSEAEVDARTRWQLLLAIAFTVAAGSVGVTHALGT